MTRGVGVPGDASVAGGFLLHPRLEADTFWVTDLPVCSLRLMDDRCYPWLILVPRLPDVESILDLEEDTAATVWKEVRATAGVLLALETPDRLNVATLGNLVPQLHIHVVARRVGDNAWPGPVWGRHPPEPYGPGDAERWIRTFRGLLDAPAEPPPPGSGP